MVRRLALTAYPAPTETLQKLFLGNFNVHYFINSLALFLQGLIQRFSLFQVPGKTIKNNPALTSREPIFCSSTISIVISSGTSAPFSI